MKRRLKREQRLLDLDVYRHSTDSGIECQFWQEGGRGYKVWCNGNRAEEARDAAFVSQFIAWRHGLGPRPYINSRFATFGKSYRLGQTLLYGYETQIARLVDEIDGEEYPDIAYWHSEDEEYYAGPKVMVLVERMFRLFHRRKSDGHDIRPGNIGICGNKLVVIDFGYHTLDYDQLWRQTAALKRHHRETWETLL